MSIHPTPPRTCSHWLCCKVLRFLKSAEGSGAELVSGTAKGERGSLYTRFVAGWF